MKERLAIARFALDTFQEVVGRERPSKLERDAAIQRFEYTVEACWKAAQRYLRIVEGLTVGSPKGAIRASKEVGFLTDDLAIVGLEMVDDRNLTVHTYNEAVAERIYGNLPRYADFLTRWLAPMAQRAAESSSPF